MLRQFCLDQPENFKNRQNILKGCLKFPIEISEWKMCLPFAILHQFQPPSWNYDQVELILGSLGKLGLLGKW